MFPTGHGGAPAPGPDGSSVPTMVVLGSGSGTNAPPTLQVVWDGDQASAAFCRSGRGLRVPVHLPGSPALR